jgi:hypothetical protein
MAIFERVGCNAAVDGIGEGENGHAVCGYEPAKPPFQVSAACRLLGIIQTETVCQTPTSNLR